MTREQVLEDITGIFREVLDIDDLDLTFETSANDVEEWNSLSHIRLIVAVEQHYRVKFKLAEIGELQNVGEFIDLLLTKIK